MEARAACPQFPQSQIPAGETPARSGMVAAFHSLQAQRPGIAVLHFGQAPLRIQFFNT